MSITIRSCFRSGDEHPQVFIASREPSIRQYKLLYNFVHSSNNWSVFRLMLFWFAQAGTERFEGRFPAARPGVCHRVESWFGNRSRVQV